MHLSSEKGNNARFPMENVHNNASKMKEYVVNFHSVKHKNLLKFNVLYLNKP